MRRYSIQVGDRSHVIDVQELSADRFSVLVEGRVLEVRLVSSEDVSEAVISPEIPHGHVPSARRFKPQPAESLPPLVPAAHPQQMIPTTRPAAEPAALGDESARDVRAPMPGVIQAVEVAPGDKVAKGEVVAKLEAMKMVNAVRSPRDGKVAEVRVQAGQNVGFNAVILTFEA